uniref:Fibronectin type-III domain-containing protein n=1 Tax=Rodentolepis nana TaxID=102285 RepID=A0A158QHR9_RODNA
LIGEPLVNSTTKGKEAELVCRVKANPPPKASSVYWRRVTDDTPLTEVTASIIAGEADGSASDLKRTEKTSITGLRCNQEFVSRRAKYYVKCFTPEPYHLVSTLYITDVDPSDVGRYECFVDNGIGSPVVRLIDLIYPFAPKILEIPRWMRAAPPYDPSEMGFSNRSHHLLSPSASIPPTTVVCIIAAEPIPTVTWFRDPANLTLVEGGQFKSSVTRLHAGRYRALLTIEFVKQVDYGSYYCQAKNGMGMDVGKVVLGPTTSPGRPGNPVLVKSTSSSLTVGWRQAFNGGPPQTFIVKWAPDDAPDAVQTAEVKEDPLSEVTKYTIENLPKVTRYRICVGAKNSLHKPSPFTDYLIASTAAAADPIEEAMRDEAHSGSSGSVTSGGNRSPLNENPGYIGEDGTNTSSPSVSMIITIATCFGCLIFITNLIIVGLVLHRRHQKKNSGLKRIPGTDSLVKCGVMDGYPIADCYPDRFINGQHVFGPFIDSASQKDSLSQYQFEHFGQCSPQMPAEYISSTGSYFPRESPLNLFTNSPTLITPEQHAMAMHHQQQQHRMNPQTLSRSSSPLHSSRSHGIQPATPSSLEHSHQRHPSFSGGGGSGGVYPPDQSIYLVAAPNPHRYIADDPLAAASLYGGLQPGAVSPHSLTDKSIGGISDGRGGIGNGGPGSGSYASSGGRVVYTGANTLGYHASTRMITSFYTPQRHDLNPGASNTLAPHIQTTFGQVPRRNSSFATPDRNYPLENTTIGNTIKRPVVNFATDGNQPPIMQVTDMDTINAVGTSNDLTMSSDLGATIPPPTDFGLPPPPPQSGQEANVMGPQYPSSQIRHHFGLSGESGIEWLGSPSRQPPVTLIRGSSSPQSQNPNNQQQGPGVHFDLKM